MRIIIIGDRSRYQFLRIINPKGEQTVFHTEELAKKDVYILSEFGKKADGCFYSTRIPLGTEIVFPSEFTASAFPCEMNDKILLFDEFPYRTESEIAQYKQYIENNRTLDCSIIIVDNHVETLETDITDMKQAISDAVQKYQSEGFFVSVYDIGKDKTDFLFRKLETLKIDNETEYALKVISNGRSKLKITFDISYKRALMLEADIYAGNPNFIYILGSLMKYDKRMREQYAFGVLERTVCDYFWGDSKNKYFKFVAEFYQKKAKDYVGEYCLWDFDKDLAMLNEDILKNFQKNIQSQHKKEFVASEIEYELFEDLHKKEINSFRNRIIDFFNEDLKQIIKSRLLSHIENLEKILKGK